MGWSFIPQQLKIVRHGLLATGDLDSGWILASIEKAFTEARWIYLLRSIDLHRDHLVYVVLGGSAANVGEAGGRFVTVTMSLSGVQHYILSGAVCSLVDYWRYWCRE